MKFLFVLFLLTAGAVNAQKDTSAVLSALVKLEQALIEKDSVALDKLLHKDVAYGHSSGWVQNKRTVVEDMRSGFLVYKKFENHSITINAEKEKAIVKEKVSVSGARDGKTFDLNLFVLEVWLRNKTGWQLYARQSTKLNN